MRKIFTKALGVLALVGAAACGAESETAPAALVIEGATMIDGTGAPPLENAVVVIEDGRIVAAGPAGEVAAPAGAEIIDARGKWITPGLVDAHVHFFQTASIFTRPDGGRVFEDLQSYADDNAYAKAHVENYFKRYLASGVTAVVDAGGPMWNFDVRAKARETEAAPRVAVAGPLVKTISDEAYDTSMLGFPGDQAIIYAATPEEAREIVRKQLSRDPDLIKVWYVVSDEQPAEETFEVVKAAAEEAHGAGVRLAIHATQLETAKLALEAGADVLVHSVFNTPVDQEFVSLLKERGAVSTTTIMVLEGYVEAFGGSHELMEIERRFGDPDVIAAWSTSPEETAARYRGNAEGTAEQVRTAQMNTKALIDADVPVAAGTDAGNPGTLHGPALHRELELLAEAGLTPMQVLVAATRDAARVFAAEPEFGTIEAGKYADLLLLNADPLAAVANLQAIDTVFVGGTAYKPDALIPPGE